MDVCAVVVTFQPQPALLQRQLQALRGQVDMIVVIDNGSEAGWHAAVREQLDARGELLALGGNCGLAAAQNAGIARARMHGAGHVLLMDQDSVPQTGMVATLRAALERLSRQQAVAAVGPRFHDQHAGRDAPFVRVRFPFNRKLHGRAGQAPLACDFLISSGCLVPMAVLDAVGEMDAGLFIDNVDLEWSFRARAHGFALFGVPDAVMLHSLGDGRSARAGIVLHGPLRLYYMMRNRLRLYRLPQTPRRWVWQDLPRVLVKLFLFAVVVGPRWRNLYCMLRGLGDGLAGRQGPAPAAVAARAAGR